MMRLYQQLYIAQPQTNAGQRTVGKITAPIELIEYTVLFGNRNADAIIRHPYRDPAKGNLQQYAQTCPNTSRRFLSNY